MLGTVSPTNRRFEVRGWERGEEGGGRTAQPHWLDWKNQGNAELWSMLGRWLVVGHLERSTVEQVVCLGRVLSKFFFFSSQETFPASDTFRLCLPLCSESARCGLESVDKRASVNVFFFVLMIIFSIICFVLFFLFVFFLFIFYFFLLLLVHILSSCLGFYVWLDTDTSAYIHFPPFLFFAWTRHKNRNVSLLLPRL